MKSNYEKYKQHLQKVADINHSAALLQWDQETYMPSKSASSRAQQLATLAGISHELGTDKDLGQLLDLLVKDGSLSDVEKRNVLQSKKDYDKSLKYTTAFVKEMSLSVSEAFHSWNQAKKTKQFGVFAPKLGKVVDLKRKECELVGYQEHPYDALLDEFEPGMTTKTVQKVFNGIKNDLIKLLKSIATAGQNNDDFMYQHYPKDSQWQFGLDLLKQMGYDFNAGRQDISTHPFTTSFSAEDVRITTRINEYDLNEMIWSTIHEGGHALYEQGLLSENYGLPSGSYLSLSIHESQSRLWENNVGRSLDYWKGNFSKLQKYFPGQLAKVNARDFYKAMNVVKPSLIRTSADELTYHFHIMIRFEIEKELISGAIDVNDLPKVWNEKYKNYLGVDVPSDDKGVLQDIHWSHGSFGYFPTYSLGSFYAAQFYHQANKDISGLSGLLAKGNMEPLLQWLRTNIHRHGHTYSADELCIKVTGETLNSAYFLEYVSRKYSDLYSIL